jgi:hypothetical protein
MPARERIARPRDTKSIRRDARGRFTRDQSHAQVASAEVEQLSAPQPPPSLQALQFDASLPALRLDGGTNPVKVGLTRVHIPAMSTVGYGYGQLEDGTSAVIVADQRPMRGVAQTLAEVNPPILVYAEVVATGEIADDIADQWNDQWAISDTEGQ